VHHTSGLRDWPGALRVAGFRFDDVITFAQILEMVRRQRDLDFDPGTRHSYSNTGYNLLAKIVEEVSGVSLAKWTKGHFFDPLGMRDTHFHDDHTRVVRNRAYAYRQVKDGWRGITDNLTAVGSSSLFASADDLGRWVLNFDDDKIAGAAALKRMHTPGTLDDGKQLSYCFGVRRSRFAGLDTVDHTGSWAGFKTCIVRFPAQRFAVVVLANTATVNPSRQAREIARLYLADELRPEPDGMGGAFARAVDAGRVAGERLLDLEGRYHSAEFDTAYTVEVRGARLAMLHFRNEDVVLRQTGAKDRFRGNRSWATTVRFVRDANQAVAALLISNGHNRDLRFDRVADRAK
jgi:CubicO group peptidase (beta-lactamase class C family)